jgi:flagellar hook-associated protein 2
MSTIFSGTSRYSADFKSIIERSVAISSLHLKQMQYQQEDLTAQSTALSTLDQTFESLQSSIDNLQSSYGLSSYSASSSSAAVTANVSSGVLEGSYSIDVISLGSNTNTISQGTLPVVADPYQTSISTSTSFTLNVNGTEHTITPASGSLVALAQAINASDADVQASIVNTGGSASPNYRLAIRSTKLAGDTIQLNDGSADLLSTLATGTAATYKVNGIDQVIESDSRTVTLAPGLTVNLVQATAGEAATVTVGRDTSSLQTALETFVTQFNAAVDAVDAHRGKESGALAGQSILNELTSAMRQIALYKDPTGKIRSMSNFGLELDSSGKLSLNTAKFASASPADIETFLGSTTSGGFLKAAYDAIDSVEHPGSGSLERVMSRVTEEIKNGSDAIADEQERIDRLQRSLEEKMAAADALIASLEQQVTYMTNLFTSMSESSKNS